MAVSRKQYAVAFSLFVFGVLLAGCSTAPKGPQPGTPAFYWAAAKEMYRQGDYVKTNNNLSQITRTENEFTSRARVWEVVMSAGLAGAYDELAEFYERGAKAARNNPAPFRREVSALRRQAGEAALQLAEAFHRLQSAEKEETLPLDFEFPTGSTALPAELKRVTSGILIPEAELELVTRAMIRRAVIMSACQAVGAAGDPAKAQEFFKAPEPRIPTTAFRVHMASELYDVADVFSPTKLDQPQRTKVLLQQAMLAIEAAPATKDTKALTRKINVLMDKQKLK